MLPCQRRVLKTDTFAASAALDLNLPTVHLSGLVTVNGAAMPASPLGRERGQLRFAERSGTGLVSAGVGSTGPAMYQATLLVGSYDVRFANAQDCPQGAVPCQTTLVQEALGATGDASWGVDLKVLQVSGQVTVNGAASTHALWRAGARRR